MARRAMKRFELRSYDRRKKEGKKELFARLIILQDAKERLYRRKFELRYQSFFVIYDGNEEVIEE